MIRPVVLLIIDGWGIAAKGKGNAITLAKIPFYDSLLKNFPHGLLLASGEAVGLPKGEAGNTETGHINLGAGTIVYQDLPRINMAIADGSFFKNQAFLAAINHARKYESKIHLLGLIGSGGVHSNLEHLIALLQLCQEQSYKKVFIHLITDGRDSPPKSAYLYIEQLQKYLQSLNFAKIASVMGRYYAMDRDRRWDRTKTAYFALTHGIGEKADHALQVIDNSYKKGITDEFIKPAIIYETGKPVGLIGPSDSVIFLNFRIDRPRQLTKAFVLDDFDEKANTNDFDPYAVKYFKKHLIPQSMQQRVFNRGAKIPHLYFVTMTEYSQEVHASNVAFPPNIVEKPLAACLAEAGLRQLRLAESEKERFVTYYFNGLREVPFEKQDILIIPSPSVPTYDLKPDMSAKELTEELLAKIELNIYDFILVNLANPDMVGHTGNISAAIIACETVDYCLAKIIPEVLKADGTAFLIADHGNVEEMINYQTATIDTEHSTNPVPFIAINKRWQGKNIQLPQGILADIAPTILANIHLDKPKTMTGRNLLENIID